MNPNRLKFRRTASSARQREKVLAKVEINPDLAGMSWASLRKMASDRGVYKFGMSRVDVEVALS